MASLESNIQLEASEQRGIFDFIDKLPAKSGSTFRIFDRGEYYTIYHDDAYFAAKEIFKTAGVIKKLGAKNVPSVALSPKNFQYLLRELLLVKQYRVQVYGNKSGSGKVKEQWELQYAGSPGNLTMFEDVLYADHEMTEAAGAGCVAIRLAHDEGRRVIGLAFCDASRRQIYVSQFEDSEMLVNLETALVQLSPKEAVIASGGDAATNKNLLSLLQRMNLLVTERNKADFAIKDLPQDLARILTKGKAKSFSVTTLEEWELAHAMAGLAALVKYLELLSSEANFHVYVMEAFDLRNFMRLGGSAVRALNLLPGPGESNVKNTHLFGVLNKCSTSQGQRLLGQWIKQPLMDVHQINERLDFVEAFMDAVFRQSIKEDHLKRFPDLQRMAKKLQRGMGTLSDVYAVFQAAKRLPALIEALRAAPNDAGALFDQAFVQPLNQLATDFSKYVEMVEVTVDASNPHDLCIKASFDEDLQRIRGEMDTLEKSISKELDKAARELGLEAGKVIKLESTPQLGWFLRVTSKGEAELRKNKNYTAIETNKSGVKFNNARLAELNEEFLQRRREYGEAEESIKTSIIQLAQGYAPSMQRLNDLIARLDVLVSFATVSSNAPTPYVRPQILAKGNGVIRLPQARHPVLEVQDDVNFIANDAVFDKENGTFFHIITGPNMGGKSTYIRTVGMLVVMAQMGCFIPCSDEDASNPPTVTVVDAVLTRVGAGDSQLKGVSTFMAEMLESAQILSSATADSLIINDELGRGTSTYDGFGLAWGISEKIAQEIGSFSLFATHFHELTALQDHVPGVANFHVTAVVKTEAESGQDSMTLLYTVQPGVCDQSFGIHVASLAHFPVHVIEEAKRKAAKLEDFQNLGAVDDASVIDDDGNGAKKRKTEREAANQVIEAILQEWADFKKENPSKERRDEKMKEIRERVAKTDNQFLLSFLKTVKTSV